jgi:hypothetical protein
MRNDTQPFTASGTLVIPYGIAELPAGRTADWLAASPPPFPCEVIDVGTGRALKLNNSRYGSDFAAGSADPFDAIRQHLSGLCGTWSRTPQRFLDYYFAEVEAVVEEARDELSRILSPYHGLFTYRDWRYSAPKPLPRAFLPLSDAFVQVEFAFWLGNRLLAVQSEPGALTPRAAAELTAHLARAGIECVSYGLGDLVPGNRALLTQMLGRQGLAFWSGETLPAGPFRPRVPVPS